MKSFPSTLIIPSSLIAPHLIYLNITLSATFFRECIVVLDSYEDKTSETKLFSLFPNVIFIKSKKNNLVKNRFGFPEEDQEEEYVNLLVTGILRSSCEIITIQDQDDFVLDKSIYDSLITPILNGRKDVNGLFKRDFPVLLQDKGLYSVTTSLFSFNKYLINDKFHLIPAEYNAKGEVLYDTFDAIWSEIKQSRVGYLTTKDNLNNMKYYAGLRHGISILLLNEAGKKPTYQSSEEIDFVLKANNRIYYDVLSLKNNFPHLPYRSPGLYQEIEDENNPIVVKLNNITDD